MPSYEIHEKGKDTGRKRHRVYSAPTEEDATKLAEADGTSVEAVSEIPPEPPTERQISYARDLAISVPSNATKDDLSDLISLKIDRDKPATERHKAFGRSYGLDFTNYIGKKALFNRIHAALIAPGREKQLLSWFTFRVYRELAGGAENAPITGPSDPIIEEIAAQLSTDEKILKSVRRYEGADLIWFGEWTAPNGTVHNGGSKRTSAYKEAAALLKQRAKLPEGTNKSSRSSAQQGGRAAVTATESKGCLSVIALAFALPALAYTVVWLRDHFA
nr:hypothetical protein [uncultured bacterium]